jgi:hypothetical protein
VAGGENTLNDGGRENNTYYWGFRRVGKRTVVIGRIFDRVFGAASPNERPKRIRLILSGQLVNPKVLEESLEWIEHYAGGEVRDHIYGVAVAPYFGNKKDVLTRDGLTVDDVCSILLERVTGGNNRHVQALHALSRKYGVKSVAYEGGVDLGQYTNAVDVKIQSQFDPRAGQAVEQYLNNWFDSGGDVLMYYNLCSRYSRHGYWGLTDEITRTRAPKNDAAARVARQRPRE